MHRPWYRDPFDLIVLFETVTVVVLFANMFTTKIHAVASIIGPIHGCAYLGSIAMAFMMPEISQRAKWWSIAPVVGCFIALAARNKAREQGTVTAAASADPS